MFVSKSSFASLEDIIILFSSLLEYVFQVSTKLSTLLELKPSLHLEEVSLTHKSIICYIKYDDIFLEYWPFPSPIVAK